MEREVEKEEPSSHDNNDDANEGKGKKVIRLMMVLKPFFCGKGNEYELWRIVGKKERKRPKS